LNRCVRAARLLDDAIGPEQDRRRYRETGQENVMLPLDVAEIAQAALELTQRVGADRRRRLGEISDTSQLAGRLRLRGERGGEDHDARRYAAGIHGG
jgi:hypothetical protein